MSKKRKGKRILTRGMGLAVKLFELKNMSLTAAKLSKTLKGLPYAPKKKKDIAAGFSKVKSSGSVVSGDFIAGFRVPVLTYDADGGLSAVHHVSADKGHVLIKLERGTVEVRGSERLARRFKRLLEEATDAQISPLNLNGGTKILYDKANTVASVVLADIEKTTGSLNKVQFNGEDIKTEDEIGLYTRKYNGRISRFRGTFPYPSGAFLTTIVNANSGSLLIYRTGDGIFEKDLNWIVELMEDAALSQR